MRPLTKKQPSYFLKNIQDEINRVVEDTFSDFEFPSFPFEAKSKIWRPAVEMREQKDSYIVKAQLPGLSKEDIDVEMGEDSITIKAETKVKKEEKSKNLYKSEFRYGKFFRTVMFPTGINSKNATASYKNGVLSIEIPKSKEETKKLKKLEIKE